MSVVADQQKAGIGFVLRNFSMRRLELRCFSGFVFEIFQMKT
jgi:hypothetical protein